jgi:nitroreductase
MIMETWDALRARRNIRSFAPEPLPDEVLARILEAGRRAPSARNTQPWDFVVVTEREQLRELATVWQGGAHIAEAAAAIALVTDDSDEDRVRMTIQYDLGQATMAMMIAAADQGVGTGHSSVADQETARAVLGFPAGKRLAYVIDVGYPADRPLAPLNRPNRRPFDEVVHRGRW